MSAATQTPTADRPAQRRSRWAWGVAALLVAMLASLAVACGDDGTASEAPTATPDATEEPTPADTGVTINAEDRPPTLTVAARQLSMEAGLGTFCWKLLCADTTTITPAEPLWAIGGTELSAELASETIAEVSVSATLQ